MIKNAIAKLTERADLTYEEVEESMTEIMTGKASDAQIAAYLTALRMKGESVDEIAASVTAMRKAAIKPNITCDCIDIVGTGGDHSNSFNISTCSSFIVAAGGIKVAKHGNRSVSSKCGAADVLESLGANLKTSPDKAHVILQKCGFVFLHAQVYHPAMRYVAPVRGELGIRTIFNILGPLANPAGAGSQLLGAYSKDMAYTLAEVLAKIGVKRLISVYGDGLDEVSPSGQTYCCQIFDGNMKEYSLTPKDFGLAPHKKEEIVGGEPNVNAQILTDVLSGKKGAYRDAAVANSGLALYIGDKVTSPYDGARLAEEIIDSGKAFDVLNNYIEATREV